MVGTSTDSPSARQPRQPSCAPKSGAAPASLPAQGEGAVMWSTVGRKPDPRVKDAARATRAATDPCRPPGPAPYSPLSCRPSLLPGPVSLQRRRARAFLFWEAGR